MAKKGYPGLVLVPPSDRTILRRRLIRGALLIVAVIWTVSTFTAQPPAPDNTTACQYEAGHLSTGGSPENCDQSPSTTQTDARPNEFGLTQVSKAEGLAESSNLSSSPKPDPDPSPTQHITEQSLRPRHSDVTEHHADQLARNPDNETSTASRPSEKSVSNLDVDAQLAAQGDAFAQYRLGRYYAQRDGRQTPESVGWYKKASSGLHRLAETGNAQAMYVLGVMYAYGRGVGRNTEEARRWLTRAVENKITAAQPVLASLETNRSTDPKLPTINQGKNVSQHH